MSDPLHTCPDCKNRFVQPFTCTTCGAEKLYDATVRSLQAENTALRAVLRKYVNEFPAPRNDMRPIAWDDMEDRARALLAEGKV
jgi:hypothetical protein